MNQDKPRAEYAGFWIRLVAALIDLVLIAALLGPLTIALTGKGPTLTEGGLINFLVPAVVIIAFWNWKSATPGKLLLRLEIVDAGTLGKPAMSQWLLRYLGYVLSAIVVFLGFIWVGFDERKRGWHDRIATTAVIRRPQA